MIKGRIKLLENEYSTPQMFWLISKDRTKHFVDEVYCNKCSHVSMHLLQLRYHRTKHGCER